MVLVCYNHDFVFLKTFKTASTSVEEYLEKFCMPPGADTGAKLRPAVISEYGIVGSRGKAPGAERPEWHGHMTAAEVREKLGAEKFDSYTKLITIRNPFPRLVSAFQVKGLNREESVDMPTEDQIAGFREWLVTKKPALDDKLRYLVDDKPIADMAIRMEHLNDDLTAFTEKVGLPKYVPEELGHFRAATRRKKMRVPYEHFYDAKTEAFIRDKFAWELETFGYDMGQVDQHFPALEEV